MVLCVCMHVYHMHAQCPGRSEAVTRALATVIAVGCQPPCRFWDLSPGPLQEQQMYLPADPSIQHHHCNGRVLMCAPAWLQTHSLPAQLPSRWDPSRCCHVHNTIILMGFCSMETKPIYEGGQHTLSPFHDLLLKVGWLLWGVL